MDISELLPEELAKGEMKEKAELPEDLFWNDVVFVLFFFFLLTELHEKEGVTLTMTLKLCALP